MISSKSICAEFLLYDASFSDQTVTSLLKERYVDPSEVANAHIHEILALPTNTGVSKHKINNFYNTILGHVRALKIIGNSRDVAGNV